MRFLMLNWRDPRNPKAGGAERVTLGYLQGLQRRGHEVAWFTNAFPGAAPEELVEGVPVVRRGFKGSSVPAAIAWYRRQPRFDLVIDQHHGIPWYAPWWARTPCVAYVHEVLGPIWDVFYRWPTSVLGRRQERWTHWLYRRIPFWTASASTRDGLLRHGVRHVTLLPYGVATPALPALDPKPLAPPLRLIVVSRLAPNKRIDHALLTLRELRRRTLDAHLTVVGTGEEETPLRRLAAAPDLAGHVRFTGALSEGAKDQALREAHLLLHTSLREGWGLNVIEANALGTPGVVYPVAGLIESTLHDQTGLVATAETPTALADAVERLLSQPERYEAYRQHAWARARTLHWDVVLPTACAWLEERAREGRSPAAPT